MKSSVKQGWMWKLPKMAASNCLIEKLDLVPGESNIGLKSTINPECKREKRERERTEWAPIQRPGGKSKWHVHPVIVAQNLHTNTQEEFLDCSSLQRCLSWHSPVRYLDQLGNEFPLHNAKLSRPWRSEAALNHDAASAVLHYGCVRNKRWTRSALSSFLWAECSEPKFTSYQEKIILPPFNVNCNQHYLIHAAHPSCENRT